LDCDLDYYMFSGSILWIVDAKELFGMSFVSL
jgi:hypothetical protein